MAPDTVASWLRELPSGARILDPMCGSGVVIRQSALLGHRARGFDIDPLAVLMSKVWTRKGDHTGLRIAAVELVDRVKALKRFSIRNLPWIEECMETRQFVEYWFSEPQRSQLARLSWGIEHLRKSCESWICDALQLGLSRIIVTKQVGASLAWDVSHSRPHKVMDSNDFDVYAGYLRAISRLESILDEEALPKSGMVKPGDCRKLPSIKRGSIDAVITSPPYLNAIDYLRGHKLALVWMGYTIPRLRELRSTSIGTERTGTRSDAHNTMELERAVSSIRKLPQRQRAIVHKYAEDARLMLGEMKRVLNPKGLMVLVLGDSNLRGTPVYNSKIFKYLATQNGFLLEDERKRPLKSNRRYLPISESSGALANRMHVEVLQSYRVKSSA